MKRAGPQTPETRPPQATEGVELMLLSRWHYRAIIAMATLAALASVATAKTWIVEKDGSGGFTVIQDALDAAASGDTVRVGPGRFEDFRIIESLIDGHETQVIAGFQKPNVTMIGAGKELTTIGPPQHVDYVDDIATVCIYTDRDAVTSVSDVRIEHVRFPVTIRARTLIENCDMFTSGDTACIGLIEGDSTVIRDCEVTAVFPIFTGAPAVTNLRVENCNLIARPNNTDFAIVIGNGSTGAVIDGCYISGFGAGIQTSLGGTATITNTTIENIHSGSIDLSSGHMVVEGCIFGAGSKNTIVAGQGLLECSNTIIGGGTNSTITTTTSLIFRNNDILNGGNWTLRSQGPAFEPVDVAQNWWGTTDTTQIAAWIDDLNDTVTYLPILDRSVDTEPMSVGGFRTRFGIEEH